ncbi:immunity 49 family protein [Vibrio europaeus]|uniref:Imm49 family immunity protein n=1 Tax=Vibrio europaeus TaxID=300876 RepID=UPI00233FC8BF|nr:Imm49 family immunity protein [Vibrio europaeus]MDC5850546.1 immunity 49 family protein [Vibrio europaeus]
MYDFSQHYLPERLKESGALEGRPQDLIVQVHRRIETFNLLGNERYPFVMGRVAHNLVGYAVQCEIFGCAHNQVKWLLKEAVNAYRAHFNMERLPGKEVTFELFGQTRRATGEEQSEYTLGAVWLNAVCLAELVGDKSALADLLAYPTENFLNVGSISPIKTTVHFVDLVKAFFGREQDTEVKSDVFNRYNALAQPGVITSIDTELAETYAWFVKIPLFQLVGYLWGAQQESLEEIVQAAMQANYDYFSQIAPQPGQVTGPESLDLNDNYALMHVHLLAFLRVIYLQRGEVVDIESPFLPLWLIKGEGPTLDELNQTTPKFDLSMFER